MHGRWNLGLHVPLDPPPIPPSSKIQHHQHFRWRLLVKSNGAHKRGIKRSQALVKGSHGFDRQNPSWRLLRSRCGGRLLRPPSARRRGLMLLYVKHLCSHCLLKQVAFVTQHDPKPLIPRSLRKLGFVQLSLLLVFRQKDFAPVLIQRRVCLWGFLKAGLNFDRWTWAVQQLLLPSGRLGGFVFFFCSSVEDLSLEMAQCSTHNLNDLKLLWTFGEKI